jgi:plastocyanin
MPLRQKKSTQSRPAAAFSATLEKKLASYATAASAAGLTLAAASPANAKVVYTPANITVTGGTTLDLNNDGTADFYFVFEPGDHSSALAIDRVTSGNSVLCGAKLPCLGAMVGNYGQAVGPQKGFVGTSYTNAFSGRGVFMANFAAYGSKTYFFGPWANKKNKYVGFKFLVDGKVHYGWARMSVPNYGQGNPVTISGYAYETIPNVRIIEGPETGLATEQPDAEKANSQTHTTLGMLAGGAGALPIWRRENQ